LVNAESGDKGRGLPVAEGRRTDASLPLGSASMAPRHIGRCPRFINKNKSFNVQPRPIFTPFAPPARPRAPARWRAGFF
jgi:hypothetical protein